MSTTEPEQITNTEDLNIESGESSTPSTPKVKDPKKVKAGKALAKKNAEARKNSSQEERLKEPSSTNVGVSRLADVSTIYNGILSMGALVGAGFTLYQGWKFFERSDSLRSLQDKFIPNKSKVEEPKEVKEVKEVKKTPLISPSLRG